ncbi:adenylyl-sulfate kinase [Paenibacillus gansuensis]|uniref:Adenylyl-sulfate kinase n=1 Tax=Paenibacillus gansuensis TaxID=306542 RepID=A0ABW5PI18_9BACL
MPRDVIERMNGHKGGVVWFTGLPGSGKTTLANEVEKEMIQCGIRCVVIDGDCLRKGLNKDLGFSEAHRIENLRRAAEVALMFVEAGFLVLAAFISPSESGRMTVRQCFHREDYTELYIKCSLTECKQRDPKGMYRLAEAGELPNFTGISAPYEPPVQPDFVLDTEKFDLQHCTETLTHYLRLKLKN